MNVVEMQPAVLPSTFPISDARPPKSAPYIVHDNRASPYAESRQSSKENRTPPLPEKHYISPSISPRAVKGVEIVANGAVPLREPQSPQSTIAGKKRSASGQIKETEISGSVQSEHIRSAYQQDESSASSISNVIMTDARPEVAPRVRDVEVSQLTQQLRTRLTYAMVKVQNGWQNRSLEEVESLASMSPRSTTFNHYSNNAHLLSPRVAIADRLNQQTSDTSTVSTASPPQQTRSAVQLMSPPPAKKGLAPPANIVSRPPQNRRRPTPNMQVHVGDSPQQQQSFRPTISQRTPSQNAAMEADAVETLLFMASPNNSGNHSSQFSPVTSAPSVRHFSSQRSPLRSTFSAPISPKRVAFASNRYDAQCGRDKNTIIDSLLSKMDKESDAELEEALMHIDRYHAAKLTT